MILEIDGEDMKTIKDFHVCMAACSKFPDFYGRNLDAFWDSLTGLIERPLKIVWKNASISKQRFGVKDFDLLVEMMHTTMERDASLGWEKRFEYELTD